MDIPEYAVVISLVILFGLPEVLRGYLKNSRRNKHDLILEVSTFLLFAFVYYPAIGFLVTGAMSAATPQLQDRFAALPLWTMFLIVLVVEDNANYWYHRASHTVPLLWKVHRCHHASPEMGVGLIYRNGVLYYAIMPSLYLLFIMAYLGLWKIMPLYASLKMLVVIGAHAEVRWDRPLYKYKVLAPLAWLLEHTISTPATHYAHHGASEADGISNPNGNFGNFLFFWDLLYGTGRITRRYPTVFGLEHDPKDPWYAQLFYPVVKSPREDSELAN
ncbi:MAG: sterol desaturase family protein [Acidobacteriota bacterium]|nr:sterol desaturase family protein [Acidobacteriota bacterium]